MSFRRFTHSIRWKLLGWLGFLLLLVFAGFSAMAWELQRLTLIQSLDGKLAERVSLVSKDLRRPGQGPARTKSEEPGPEAGSPWQEPPPEPPDGSSRWRERPTEALRSERGLSWGPDRPWEFGNRERRVRLSEATAARLTDSEYGGYHYAVWNRSGNLLDPRNTFTEKLTKPEIEPGDTSLMFRSRDGFREAYQATEMGDVILAGASLHTIQAETDRLAVRLLLGGITLSILALGGGWYLAGRALSPIRQISGTAQRISLGNLAERIDSTETTSELGQLASVLNHTFARLETAFAEQRRFTADAAHELRTPLAVLIAEIQSTLARARTEEEYQASLRACLETAQRMRKLAESLLQLAHFDANSTSLVREPVDLAEVAESGAQTAARLCAVKQLRLQLSCHPAPVRGDFDQLSRVLLNLIDNAIRHSPPQSCIHLVVTTERDLSVLEVADEGEGIAPEHLPRIFDRFFRGDQARHEGGNSGLGLAICRAIVTAHGGQITVQSTLGRGARFRIELPRVEPTGT